MQSVEEEMPPETRIDEVDHLPHNDDVALIDIDEDTQRRKESAEDFDMQAEEQKAIDVMDRNDRNRNQNDDYGNSTIVLPFLFCIQ